MTNVWCHRAEFGTYTKRFVQGEPSPMPLRVSVLRFSPNGYPGWVGRTSRPCL
jgi:hypothetical protein